jgi:hypothetical protein
MPTSLSTQMTSLKGVYPTEESAWYRYVCDHRNTLRTEGMVLTLSLEDAQSYKYRPAELLRKHNLDASVVWIALMINDLRSNIDFVGITTFIIPTEDTLTKLYTAYNNSRISQQEASARLIE